MARTPRTPTNDSSAAPEADATTTISVLKRQHRKLKLICAQMDVGLNDAVLDDYFRRYEVMTGRSLDMDAPRAAVSPVKVKSAD
jgi:hypothetical protein